MARALRALLIDDDPDLLALTRRTLEFTAGWTVFTASSGLHGLVLAGTLAPDVILVDLMMPGMDGFEVCGRLKAEPATAHVPVVLLTARRDLDAARLSAVGAAGVLFKPFQPDTLAEEIRALCP